MQREDDGKANPVEDAQQGAQLVGMVGQRGAMERGDMIAPFRETQDCQDGRGRARLPGEVPQGVVHHVADGGHAGYDAFPGKVPDRDFRRTEKPLAEMIRDHPVDFLRHPPVETAQTGFDVSQGQGHFRGGQRSRER